MTVGGRGAGRLEVDAGIVDNSVHRADLVHLIGEVPGLGGAAEVAGDDSRGVWGEAAERRRPLAAAGVEDNVMAFTDEDTGGASAESVGGAGDEDTGHGVILPSVARQAPDSGSDPERSPLPRVVLRRQPGNQDRGTRRWSAGGQDAKDEVLEHCRRAAESSAAEVTRSTQPLRALVRADTNGHHGAGRAPEEDETSAASAYSVT